MMRTFATLALLLALAVAHAARAESDLVEEEIQLRVRIAGKAVRLE